MTTTMGIGELGSQSTCFKRRYRWLLKISGISGIAGESAGGSASINTLPPSKSARPNVSFKEVEIKHLVETIYFPGRPEWKALNLSLFDLKRNNNPVITWINSIYNASTGIWTPAIDAGVKKSATLELYDGCGNTLESWTYDNVWPTDIEFGELDMGSSDIIMIDLTMRYDRAYTSQTS